jgi:hypothetical protein
MKRREHNVAGVARLDVYRREDQQPFGMVQGGAEGNAKALTCAVDRGSCRPAVL